MVGIWLALLMCGSIAMIFVQLLPQERIKNNIRSSCELMQEEGVYPTLGIPQTAYCLDNWTEASLLEFIYHADNERPIYSAFVAEEVNVISDSDSNGVKKLAAAVEDESLDVIQRPSYWNGFIVFLRPLLYLFDYYVARGILHKLAMILVGLFVIWNARRVGYFEAIGTTIILSAFTVYVLSMNFTLGIFCLFIAMGAAVYLYEKKNTNYLTAMFVVGILIATVIGIIIFYYKHCSHEQSYIKILLLIALAPLAWYIVFSGHINHIGIEFRTLMITCYAVWFVFKPRKYSQNE